MTDHDLAEALRAACLRALLDAYEDAGMQGLCAEGRWEYAVQALRRLDAAALLAQARSGGGVLNGRSAMKYPQPTAENRPPPQT